MRTGKKKGKSLHVVPVEVAEQDAASERLTVKGMGQPAQASTSIENQRWRRSVVREADT